MTGHWEPVETLLDDDMWALLDDDDEWEAVLDDVDPIHLRAELNAAFAVIEDAQTELRSLPRMQQSEWRAIRSGVFQRRKELARARRQIDVRKRQLKTELISRQDEVEDDRAVRSQLVSLARAIVAGAPRSELVTMVESMQVWEGAGPVNLADLARRLGGVTVVAPADAPPSVKDAADMVCTGVADQDVINAALTQVAESAVVITPPRETEWS